MSQSIFVRQQVDASREELWEACATARGMATWQADVVEGDAANSESVILSWPGLNLSVEAEVEEIVPQQRVVFGVGPSRLTLEIDPGAVRLTHEGLRSDDEVAGMQSAWRCSLGLLGQALRKHQGRERQVRWVTSRAKATPELCHFYFTNEAALAQWLTTSGAVTERGQSIQLRLLDGASLSGTVLANTNGRDVALTWQEQAESCLVLRTFPSPKAADERLLALAWSRWTPEPFSDSSVRFLESALGRLAQILDRRGNA